ncbi:SpaA isopeptide-forming pilin-related protein [Enterococcus mundtii]
MKAKMFKRSLNIVALFIIIGQLIIAPSMAIADHIEEFKISQVDAKDEELEQDKIELKKVLKNNSILSNTIKQGTVQSENARANDSPEESELPVVETIGNSLFILPSGTNVQPIDQVEEEITGEFDAKYTLDYIREHAKSTTEQNEMLKKSEEYARLKRNFTRSTGFTIENVRTIEHRVWRNIPNGTNFLHDKFYMFRIRETGQIAFCIEEGVPIVLGSGASQENVTQIISNPQLRERLSLIAYFGWYGNSDKSDTQYVAVQQMIWEAFGGETLSTTVSNYGTRKQSVETEISKYNTRPSFHNQKVTVKVGETVTINDTNGVFANYAMNNLTNTANVTLRQEGNRLHITANANSNKNGIVSIARIPNEFASAALAYRVGNGQRVSVLHVDDPITVNLNIEVLKEGHAEVLKVDEDTGKPLANATYRFTTSTGQTKELTTGADGKARWENLLVDTKVTIEEIRAPHGYILNAQPQTLTIRANETTTLRFNNKEQLANLTVIKEDEETGNKPQGAATLFGAKYELTDSEGKTIAILTLEDVEGLSQAEIKGLKLGTYYLKEVEAPEGYNLDPETHEVQLTYAGQNETVAIHSKTVNDRVIKGGIEGYKFGSKDLTPSIMGNIRSFFRLGQKEEEKSSKTTNQDIKPPLEGVELTATSKTTGLKYTATTDKKGYFHIGDLPYDTYTVEETKGAPGYLLIEPFEVTITEEGYVHFYLLEDRIIEARLRILKEDAETGERIPLSGTSFKIWDRWGNDGEGAYVSMRENNSLELTDTFVTNDEGEIVTSEMLAFGEDRYELREIRAPEGYILPTEPVVFSVTGDNANWVITLHVKNDPQKGLVTVNKSVETAIQTSVSKSEYGEYTQFDFDQLKGQGFRFKIEAAEDVVTPDGTVRFKQGETIQFDGEDYILETTEDGSATSPAFLYIGSYYLIEIGAPAGVAMLEEPVPFSIEYAGQEVEVSTSEVDVDNFLQEINIYGQKDQEVVVDWVDGQAVIDVEAANNGQVFALRLAKGLTIGESMLEEDTTLAYTVVKEGVIAFEGLKLPNQTIQMYLQEVDAGSDHVLNEEKYYFTYEPETNEQTHDIHVSAKQTEMEESEEDPEQPNEEPAEEDENNEETDTEADRENENDSENPEADTDVSEEQDNDLNENGESEQEDAEEESDVILNKLARANVKVIKTDAMDQKALQGVEFDLIRIGEFKPIDSEPEDETTEGEEEQSPEEDGTEESDTETPETFTDGVGDTEETRTVIGTYVTDENGEITIEDLPTGQYVLVETKPLEWYHENDEEYDFEISADNNGETIIFEVENNRLDLEIETLFAETETGSKVVDPTVDNKLTDYAWTLGGKEGHEYFVVTQFINGATGEVVDKGISSFVSTGEEEQELLFDVMIPANTMNDGDELVATHMVYSDEELTDLVSDHFDLKNKEQTVGFVKPTEEAPAIPQAGSVTTGTWIQEAFSTLFK